ncbi:hypothetical protein, partial [Mesorhizobium sp.]|uniref:hypothetical protein n=1 Tax=Mesorhizobium sp. TaxID=1871066 RepID=UPI00344A7E6D
VGNAENNRLSDRGMLEQDLLHQPRRDLFAAVIDDILQAAGDEQITFGIEVAYVACPQPAIDESGLVVSAIIIIVHDIWAANDHLATPAGRQQTSGFIHNGNFWTGSLAH